MKNRSDRTYRRLNITLPEETVRLMDRVAKKGDRSRFIAEAVERYVAEMGRRSLRERVKEGALTAARRDLAIAEEWFEIDDEWQGRQH